MKSWYLVQMYADDYNEAVVSLTDDEANAVNEFLRQVSEQCPANESWAGGYWELCGPCNTKEEAQAIKPDFLK